MRFAPSSPSPQVLMVPGLYGSGPEHWQLQWQQRYPEFERVDQRDWDTPRCEDWVAKLDDRIAAADDDVILVGHSLGSVTIAFWATQSRRRIRGALLVAPADTEAASFPSGTTGFAPMPMRRLGFPSITVISTDDPYAACERSRAFAEAWGSSIVVMGAHGHISVSDGFGPWPEGLHYLRQLHGQEQPRVGDHAP